MTPGNKFSSSRAFRLGDVRGIYPDDIDEQFALCFAAAFVEHFNLGVKSLRGATCGIQVCLFSVH
jgi:hypothetical protein|tara:strand:+ start:2456 stop:2650 length:195 start_codon:yes stop_codon:yes gene_type:complete